MEKNKIDARKLSTEVQQEKRNIAIRLWKKKEPINKIAHIVGVHPSTIYGWKNKYLREGENSITIKQRGRQKGVQKSLSPIQEQSIINKLVDTTPQQLKFKFALWTREAVQTLIQHEYGIHMKISTVGKYLSTWQFTSKKPIKRAYERKDSATKQWLEKEYPKIKQEAKQENADVWWADETCCQSMPNNLKGYAPIGTHNKPVLYHTTKRFKINMISAITHQGKLMFSLYDESIKTDQFIDFLEKVIQSSNKKVFMVVDNLRVHHAKVVKVWEKEHSKQIKLFYLPPYSPDYNPDEYLNQDYKQSANKNRIPINKDQLRENTLNYMDSLQQNPQKISNFFLHPKVNYAS